MSVEYVYVDNNREAEKVVDYLLGFNRLAYDTETTGLDIVGNKARLLLMQIGTEDMAYLFDPRKMDAQILKPVLESKDILKIGHNCLMGDMRVILADGSKVPIYKLVKDKYSGGVWSINEKTGKLEIKKVVGWIEKGPRDSKDWIRIRVSGKGCLRITKEHEIITDKGRIRAEDIVIGDRIKTINPQLNPQQKALIYGSCLGDASLRLNNNGNKTSRSPYFTVVHATKQFEYLDFKSKILDSLSKKITIENNSRGYSKHIINAKLKKLRTSNDSRLTEFYINTSGGKEITDCWLENLNAQSFAIWYCDDGSLSGKGISICTSRFGNFGTDKLIKWMNNKNWPIHKKIRGDGQIYIIINNINNCHLKNDFQMKKVWSWFSKYVPICMSYKIHPLFKHQCSDLWWIQTDDVLCSWSDIVTEVGPLFVDEKISRYSGYKKTYPSRRKQYCLIVEENNNFITEGLAVSNCKYDYQTTIHDTGIVLRNVFDTMLAYRLLTSGLIEDGQGGFVPAGFRDKSRKMFPYKSLNFLTQRYLGITLDKSVRETFINFSYTREYTPEQLNYAAEDIVVLHPLCDILGQQLMEKELVDTALLEFAFVRPTAEMELSGVCIDKENWRDIIAEAKHRAAVFNHQMSYILAPLQEQNTLFGAITFNVKSQDQLLEAFKKLGCKLESTDKKFLKSVTSPPDAAKLAELLLDYRAYEKLISTYGETILRRINRVTNRLHFTLHQLGADTGRLSSTNPNIQNIPNDKDDPNAEVSLSFRDCFVAGEGNLILTADYSQCIARGEMVSTQWGLVPIEDFRHGGFRDSSGQELSGNWSHNVPCFEDKGFVESNFHLSKGVKDLVRVESEDGFSLRCTPDHVIKVMDREGREGWKQASWLTPDDYLVLSWDNLPDVKFPFNPITDEEALFLGYWVGDGSYSSGGIQIAKGEEKYDDVYSVLNGICVKHFGKPLKNYNGTNSWDLIGVQFHDLWSYWGCNGKWRSGTKEIPHTVLQSSRSVVSSFLRGLFETDGWVVNKDSNHVVAMSTRSYRLAQQVQLLLLSLGVFSKLASYEEETSVGGRQYKGVQHRVSVCDSYSQARFRDQIGFISKIKKDILESLSSEPHRSQTDYVLLNDKERSLLKEATDIREDSSEFRKQWFANYFNLARGTIRHYSRYKLDLLCKELGYPHIPKNHLAFSRVKSVRSDGRGEVFDISVPSQHTFVAGGMFVHNCELRILAEVSQDTKFLEIFRSGGDLHIITSQQVFKYSDEELEIYYKVKKAMGSVVSQADNDIYKMVSDYRSKTKVINFGIAYGLSAWSLADRFKLPQNEAEQILDDYFSTYHGIKRWLDKNGHNTIVTRQAETILGRKKFFVVADPSDEKMFRRSKGAIRRMGNNHVIQGCLQYHTRVLTSEGYKAIGEIYEQEKPKFVWTGNTWSEFDVINRGKYTLARLYLANGMSLDCDTRHEVLVVDDQSYKFRKVMELNSEDKVCVSLPQEIEYGTDYRDFQFSHIPKTHNGLSIEIKGLDEEFFYWLGYYYAEGNLFNRNNCLSLAFGSVKGLDHISELINKGLSHFRSLGLNPVFKKITPNKGSMTVPGKGLVELYGCLGVLPDQTSHTKRVASGVFSASLELRKVFLLGFLKGDGCEFGGSQPNIHLCQSDLLKDLLLLFRTCGVDGKLRGPYFYNGFSSYRLDLNGGMCSKFLGYSNKIYIRTNEILSKFQIEEFNSKFIPQDFSNPSSEYTITSKLRNNKNASIYKVSEMSDQLLYSYSNFKSLDVFDLEEDTYTLEVFDNLHRFDSSGIISKNTNADITKEALVKLQEAYDNIPGAKILFTVHDEIVSECPKEITEHVAEVKAEIMKEAFHRFVKTIPVGNDDTVSVSASSHWSK